MEIIVIAWKTLAAGISSAMSRNRFAPVDGHHRLIQSHWAALSKAGIPASKLIEFLQPLADAEGLSVYELPVTQINGTATVFGHVGHR